MTSFVVVLMLLIASSHAQTEINFNFAHMLSAVNDGNGGNCPQCPDPECPSTAPMIANGQYTAQSEDFTKLYVLDVTAEHWSIQQTPFVSTSKFESSMKDGHIVLKGDACDGKVDVESQGMNFKIMKAEGPCAEGLAGLYFEKVARGGALNLKDVYNVIESWNPNQNRIYNPVAGYIYESLGRWDYDNSDFIPGLAASWESHNAPNRSEVFTVKLREGVKWHNGADFDASDVIFTVEALMRGVWRENPIPPTVKNLRVVQVDKYTVQFTMDASLSNLLFIAGITPLCSSQLSHLPDGNVQAYYNGSIPFTPAAGGDLVSYFRPSNVVNGTSRVIGTGAFHLQSISKPMQYSYYSTASSTSMITGTDQNVVLKAFSDHWLGEPFISQVRLKLSDKNSDVLDESDIWSGSEWDFFSPKIPQDFASLDAVSEANSKLVCNQRPSGSGRFYFTKISAPTSRKYPLADQRVRQALRHAIDMDKVAEEIGAVAAKGIFLPGGSAFSEVPGFAYDVMKATQLLADAGYTSANPLPLNVALDLSIVDSVAMTEYWEAIPSINVTRQVFAGSFQPYLYIHTWDVFFLSLGGFNNPRIDLYRMGSPLNLAGYYDQQADAKWATSQNADVPLPERQAALAEVNNMLSTSSFNPVTTWPTTFSCWKNSIRGPLKGLASTPMNFWWFV
jgi:ABC-type transport system substrate-binding protein